jgi:predicted Rossmann-fold nucleotide-binding protein
MKALIIGSCRNNDAESKIGAHRMLAAHIGEMLAERGHEIITGGAGGLQGILVDSYKKSGGRKWTAYFAVGEKGDSNAEPVPKMEPDKEIRTKYDYAMRDLFYIGKCDAVIALSGKLLTFAEIIHAALNYDKKIFQLAIGENISRIRRHETLRKNVLVTADVGKGLCFIES